tara:strand:+ start:1265 stop:1891 length:627 start_codon:yes stop_codon:yes gene_type:complete
MSLVDSLYEFRAGIAQTNNLISIAYEQDADGNDLFDSTKKEFVITSAFLKMFIYWETFIEESFSKYLTGELSTNGTSVICYISPNNREHALKILIGTQKYVDWANHEIVRRLAKLYLENGEPLASNIASISSELSDLKTVRNAAAHLSSTTRHQLDALSSRVLSRNITNTDVATFMMQLHPSDSTKTVLQYYQNLLDIAAESIAANRT